MSVSFSTSINSDTFNSSNLTALLSSSSFISILSNGFVDGIHSTTLSILKDALLGHIQRAENNPYTIVCAYICINSVSLNSIFNAVLNL